MAYFIVPESQEFIESRGILTNLNLRSGTILFIIFVRLKKMK